MHLWQMISHFMKVGPYSNRYYERRSTVKFQTSDICDWTGLRRKAFSEDREMEKLKFYIIMKISVKNLRDNVSLYILYGAQ